MNRGARMEIEGHVDESLENTSAVFIISFRVLGQMSWELDNVLCQ